MASNASHRADSGGRTSWVPLGARKEAGGAMGRPSVPAGVRTPELAFICTFTRMDDRQRFADHVDRFNRGVTTGDFGEMAAHFAADAVMRFEGVPVGPFEGREAIVAAYAADPPDDTIVLVGPVSTGVTISAPYAWSSTPDKRAGELRLTFAGDGVTSITVTFE